MDASKKSVMKEEQELSPAANPAAAVMTAEADAIKEEEDKAAVAAAAAATSADHAASAAAAAAAVVVAGRVAGEMDMASGSGVAHLAPRSPLAAAVSGLADHVLERMVKVLMRKCHPPQEVYPLIGKSPLRPPWWPTGHERWWPELGAGAVVPPYRPARLLSKAEKEVAVVAMVKNLAPDFERLAMAVRMAPSVTSRITDAEARAWDAGVDGEREAYIARHPRNAPPTRAWSLMASLKPEEVRMKPKAPKPKPPVTIKVEDAAPFLTVSAATAAAAAEPVAPATRAAADPVVAPATAAVEATMAAIEAMKNSSKDPDAPYYPMPFPLLGHGSFEIIHTNNEVGPNDDAAENPAVWKEFNRKKGQLEFLRVGKRNDGMVIYDRVDGGASGSGPRQGRLVMETYGKAQGYYHELRNKGALASGAGVKTEDESETESDNEDEKAKAKAKTRAMLQPNKGVKTEDESETESDNDDEKAKAKAKAKARAMLQPNKGITKAESSLGSARARPTLDPARYPFARAVPDSISGHESVHTPKPSGHLKSNECQSSVCSVTAHQPTP